MNLPDKYVVYAWIHPREFGHGWFVREVITAWHKDNLEQRTKLMRDFVWIWTRP